MNAFLVACKFARRYHPIMFKHFTKATRRNIVRYWLKETDAAWPVLKPL